MMTCSCRCGRVAWLWSLGLLVTAMVETPLVAAEADEQVFSRLDANEDGVLSGKEAASVRALDADGDGEVTKDEYLAGMAAERKRSLSIDDNTLFAERDSNEDTVLSGTEVRGFEQYDADGDGEVSRAEFDKGRAADRRKMAGPSKEEQARQALEQFRKLDLNEDGRLSGKEMVGYEKRDINGDRRVTEKEFVDGAAQAPAEPAGDPVALFLEMIRTAETGKFIKATAPEFAREIDEPVLTFILARLSHVLGELDPSANEALSPSSKTLDDVVHTIYQGTLKFKEGEAKARLIVAKDRVVGFSIESPALDDVSQRLHLALLSSEKFSKAMAEFYTPRCGEFIRLILEGEDEKAFARYHPQVQQQVGLKKAQAVFGTFREGCGQFRGLELESMRVEVDAKGNGESFSVTHRVQGSKKNYFATTTFQFVGLAGHIVALSVKPVADEEASPVRPQPAKAADFGWTRVDATADGVTFEMPVKPERSEFSDGAQIRYEAKSGDKKFAFSVNIETSPRNIEAEARQILDKQQERWAAKSPDHELMDSDEVKAGTHPGRLFFLKLNNGGIELKEAQFRVLWNAIVGKRRYVFVAETSETDKMRRDKILHQFIDSARFITDDDDAAAPTKPALPGLPAPPAPPSTDRPRPLRPLTPPPKAGDKVPAPPR